MHGVSRRRTWIIVFATASFALAAFAVVVAMNWVSNPVGGPVPMPHQPGGKGVVSGTLVIVGGPVAYAAPMMTPVPGRILVANVAQLGGGFLPHTGVATGPDGTFSVAVSPGLYQVTGLSPQYEHGKGTCWSQGPPSVRVRAGEHVSVNVECQMR